MADPVPRGVQLVAKCRQDEHRTRRGRGAARPSLTVGRGSCIRYPLPMQSLWRAHWSTVKTGYVGALTLYALIAPAFVHSAINAALVLAILVLVPGAVLARYAVSLRQLRRREPWVGEPSYPSRRAINDELRRDDGSSRTVWWDRAEGKWFDEFFAFWWKVTTVPCESITLVVDERPLTVAQYEGIPPNAVTPAKPERKKAALVRLSPFLSDSDRQIHCAPIDWEFTQWVGHHLPEFEHANPQATVFGVSDQIPFPGLICVHTLLSTMDGWVLFSLRSQQTDYFAGAWSASFEEQVEIGPTTTARQRDSTVLDTMRRGVTEELGSELARYPMTTTCLGVGREHVLTGEQAVLNCGVLAALHIHAPLSAIWHALDDPGQAEDLFEHLGWFACRFSRAADVAMFLAEMRNREFGPRDILAHHGLGVDVRVHPASSEYIRAGDRFRWHPTSRARLHLWSRWAFQHGPLAPQSRGAG